MTGHQRLILLRLQTGRSYAQIAKALGMQVQSLYNTIYRMRLNGIDVAKPLRKKLPLSPQQKTILYCYMEKKSVEEIAALLKIDCSTVQNHASQGFKRLGLTVPGVDRIAALRDILDPPAPVKPCTMDDPEFN